MLFTPAGARPAAAGKSHSVDFPPLQRGTCGELLARVRAESCLIPANARALGLLTFV